MVLQPTAQIDTCFKYHKTKVYFPSNSIDGFGSSIGLPGDIDNDGNNDLIIGSTLFNGTGAIQINFLDNVGNILSAKNITSGSNGFHTLAPNARFGVSITTINDLNNDGINELIVGSLYDNTYGFKHGAIYIIFINHQGNVTQYKKIDPAHPLFINEINDGDEFGKSVTNIGDIDGNGVEDIAVGSWYKPTGGAVYIITLDHSGDAINYFKINSNTPGFNYQLDNKDYFGYTIKGIGDFDGNGINDLVISARNDKIGSQEYGAIYLCLLKSPTSLLKTIKYGQSEGNLPFTISPLDFFGDGIDYYLDNEINTRTFFVSAPNNNTFGINRGVIHMFSIDSNYKVFNYSLMNYNSKAINRFTKPNDRFGHSIHHKYNYFKTGEINTFCSAIFSDTAGTDLGAVISFTTTYNCEPCPSNYFIIQDKICPSDSIISPFGYFINEPGSYEKTYINNKGCDSTINFILSNYPQNLCEQNSPTYLSILYPNPAAEVVYLKINNFEGPLSITIHDDKSSLVKILNTQVKKNTPIPIQVGYLAAGVYMIKLNADGFTETHRLVTY